MKNWMEFLELSVMWKLSMKMLKMTMTNIKFHKSTKKQKNPPIHEKTNFLFTRLENYSLTYYQNCPQLTKKQIFCLQDWKTTALLIIKIALS